MVSFLVEEGGERELIVCVVKQFFKTSTAIVLEGILCVRTDLMIKQRRNKELLCGIHRCLNLYLPVDASKGKFFILGVGKQNPSLKSGVNSLSKSSLWQPVSKCTKFKKVVFLYGYLGCYVRSW